MLDEKDLQEISHLMNVLIENAVVPKFDLLAEKLDLMQQQLQPAERLAAVEDRLDVLESAARLQSEEIARLKKAQ